MTFPKKKVGQMDLPVAFHGQMSIAVVLCLDGDVHVYYGKLQQQYDRHERVLLAKIEDSPDQDLAMQSE